MLRLLGARRRAYNVRMLGPDAGEAFTEFEERCDDRTNARRVFAWLRRVAPEDRIYGLLVVAAYLERHGHHARAVQKMARRGSLSYRFANAEAELRGLPPDAPRVKSIHEWIKAVRPVLARLEKEIDEELRSARVEDLYIREGGPFIESFLRLRVPSPEPDPEPDSA